MEPNKPEEQQMRSGVLLDLLRPDLKRIKPMDIIDQMRAINRYNGAGFTGQMNLLGHSMLVGDLCIHEKSKPYALLHDAHEAFLGDVTKPQIAMFDALVPGFADAFMKKKMEFDRLIHQAFGLDPLDDLIIRDDIKRADYQAMRIEVSDLLHKPEKQWIEGFEDEAQPLTAYAYVDAHPIHFSDQLIKSMQAVGNYNYEIWINRDG